MTQTLVDINVDGDEYIFQVQGRGNTPAWTIGFQGTSYQFQLRSAYVHSLMGIMPAPKLVSVLVWVYPFILRICNFIAKKYKRGLLLYRLKVQRSYSVQCLE